MTETMEPKIRKGALALFGLTVVIFIVLSGLSFTSLRERPDPVNYVFDGQDGVAGKRVFQAYNCMGCHTMLGNGAYFAPDLTKVYEDGGTAWLRTYLSSPGTWPTEARLNVQVGQLYQQGLTDIATIEDYFSKYPHVAEAIMLLGGQRTVMPNIVIKNEEINALIAFFDYSAEVDTAGWPPIRMADASLVEEFQSKFGVVPPQPETVAQSPSDSQAAQPAAEVPVAQVTGDQLAKDLGCTGCHSVDGTKSIGPTWKKIFGSTVTLTDGSSVTIDDLYLQEAIIDPNAKVRIGFNPGIMPSYSASLTQEEIDLLVSYIKSLQ